MALLTGILAAIAGRIVADEAKAWMPNLSQQLLRLAVSRLPDALQERYKEEWAADLASYPGEVLRLARALGFCWAGMVIRRSPRKPLGERVGEGIAVWLFVLWLRLFAWWLRRLTAQTLRRKLQDASASRTPVTPAAHSEKTPVSPTHDE